jgi:heme ABC exporter ATP-binding subunit CcmA
MSSLIEIEALSKAYDLLPVLRKLDLSITRGEFVALLGPNGSGKSTLLRLLCGLTRPTAGTIRVGGWELPGEVYAVRAQIGLVSHKSLLYENLSARENLLFFARLYNLPPDKIDARITELLAQVGLAKRAYHLVRTFSRGMLQRLSIARALLHNPEILLLDEPYTGLDQDASQVLDDLLRAAHGGGHTIVMSTHDLTRAATLPGRILILSRGLIGYDQPAAAVDAMQLSSIYTEITSMVTTRS